MSQPGYQSILDAQIKSVELLGGAGRARVIAGAFNGAHGPAHTFTPINVWDLRLVAGKPVSLDLPEACQGQEDARLCAVFLQGLL